LVNPMTAPDSQRRNEIVSGSVTYFSRYGSRPSLLRRRVEFEGIWMPAPTCDSLLGRWTVGKELDGVVGLGEEVPLQARRLVRKW
jgi:hypothetical protein